jgi:hypothetical protein
MEANQYLGAPGRFRNRKPGKSIIQAFVSRASVKVARAAVLWLGLTPAPIFGSAAQAADTSRQLPLQRASVIAPAYDWTGFYVGSHFGYATGYSRWSGTEPGMTIPALAGSLDFFKGFDGFKGTGSYSLGLQGGSITCFHRAF